LLGGIVVEWKSSDISEELANSISMDSASFHLPLYGFVGLKDFSTEYIDENTVPTLPFGDPAIPFFHELLIKPLNKKIEPNYEVKELADYFPEPNVISHLMRFMDGYPFFIELVVMNRNKFVDNIEDMLSVEELSNFVIKSFMSALLAMRVRGLRFIAPIILNCPIDSFRDVPNDFIQQIMGYGWEDKNSRFVDFHEGPPMRLEDIEWIRTHADWFWDFFSSKEKVNSFSLSFQSLTSDQSIDSPNLRCAIYWIGIESILKLPPYAISKNLVNRITTLLPEYDKKQIISLWNMRCKTIHGQGVDSGDFLISEQLSNENLKAYTEESRVLLCKIMQRFIEEDFLPTKENIKERFSEILPEDKIP
jgi:hypothetical protein